MSLPQKAQFLIDQTLHHLRPDSVYKNMVKLAPKKLSIHDQVFEIGEAGLYIFAVGKAASYEASAFKNLVEKTLDVKLCVAYTKQEHTVDDPEIVQIEGDHPYLSERNLLNTKYFLEHLQKVPKNGAIVFLLSGGASALLELPVQGMSLEYVQKKYKKLLESGKSIAEINQYRKAMSQTKNGGLLNFIHSDQIIQFITCDIPNENLADVGSGPLMYQDIPNEVFKDLQLQKQTLQVSVSKVNTFLTNSASALLDKLNTSQDVKIGKIYDSSIEEVINDLMHDLPHSNQMHISAGEGNIALPETHGVGGRNTHFVLAMANRLYKEPQNQDIKIMSFGTDGTDGPTDAAGAYIDFETYKNFESESYLKNFDSYNFFKKTNTLIYTGPTKTNIMDVRCLWRD